MNPRRLHGRLAGFLREYGLAVGIVLGSIVGLGSGSLAIGVVAGIPIGIVLVNVR